MISQDGPWWVGWVEEVPGVNAQEQSRALISPILPSQSKAPLGFCLTMVIVALLAITGVRQFRRMEQRFADVI